MVSIKSVNQIVLNLIDYFKLVQPDLDTKPGTVARDLFIDAPASQIAAIYDELSGVANLQSIKLASGADLDKLASNFGITRNQGSNASGTALLTFKSVDAPIAINSGDIIVSNNGLSFKVTTGISVQPSQANYYKSVATKFQNDLNFLGISDTYAIQVLVQATSSGTIGNIGKYSLIRSTTVGVSNVTNTSAFTGGADQETDAAFRSRILSTFNGSSIGTALGYKNTALRTTGVVDALVIEPGDPLMTRDGTVVKQNTDGSYTIISEGQGGKVDVIVLGTNNIQTSDTFIYKDKSNTGDPTNSKNNFILGQIPGDENKTINRRRIDDIKAATLPSQPVQSIAQVTGSLSGNNFQPKTVDYLGRVSGNYELVKDSGLYAGSPWGFDYFRWVSNKVSLYKEDTIKGQLNGQDPLNYSDVLSISKVQQVFPITNENSIVTADRSIIQLLHYPSTVVTRVFNVNTGERYVVQSQNVDNTGTYNTTGRIKISGNTLPATTDVLQVDYGWLLTYDPYYDYDGKFVADNIRPSSDSIDWGYSSKVTRERVLFTKDGNLFSGKVNYPVSSIVKCDLYYQTDGVVSEVTSGIYAGRLKISLTDLPYPIETIENVYVKNTFKESYSTADDNGTWITSSRVSYPSTLLVYDADIILPTDTTVSVGQKVTVIYNSQDVYNINNSNGSFNINIISLPADNISLSVSQIYLNVFYIANAQSIFTSGISTLPASRTFNSFILGSNVGFDNNFVANNLRRESREVFLDVLNSNAPTIDLSLSSIDADLSSDNIFAVVRLSDGKVLWDARHQGTVTTNTANTYRLVLTTYNSPAADDQVLVFYYATANAKFQPISWENYPIYTQLQTVKYDGISSKYIDLINFINTSSIVVSLINPSTLEVLATVTDGYIVSYGATAKVGTPSSTFNAIIGITNYKLKITDLANYNNNGIFDIISYNSVTHDLTIGLNIENIVGSQISLTRFSDNKELWVASGEIDITNNRLILDYNNPQVGDNVFAIYYIYDNLKTSPTKLSCSSSTQINNNGTLSVLGTTITKLEDVIITINPSSSNNLKINLIEAVRKYFGYPSYSSIPSTLKLARIVKLEKVQVAGNTEEVVSVITTYDLFNSTIKDNSWNVEEAIGDLSFGNFELLLPSTQNNTIYTSTNPNLPQIGDRVRVTLYVSNSQDQENLVYTSNGTLYTNKNFALIDKIFVASGFKSSGGSILSIASMNQPLLGARYSAYYDYTAPKPNERITIFYNFNKLISDVTFNVETNRPINADVIVKSANEIKVDITMNIVVLNSYLTTSGTVVENVKNALISAINTNYLGATIDGSDLVNSAYGVSGVDRARIIYFNKNGVAGQALSLQAQKNEYFSANNVIVNIETR